MKTYRWRRRWKGGDVQVEWEVEGRGGGVQIEKEVKEEGRGGGGEEVQVEGEKGVLLQVTFTIFIHHFLENTNIRMEIGEREKKRRTGEEGKGKRRERRVENE